MNKENHCHDLSALLGDFIDQTLSDELCQKLEMHMRDCQDCRIVVDTLRRTVELYQENNSEEDLPSEVRSRLFYRLDLSEYLEKSGRE